jgi:hypothetical protein
MSYEQTIKNLFELLATANLADSDSDDRQSWQNPDDASQRIGYYGHLRSAIVAIAGEEIVEDWANTGEVDMSLANRRN